MSVYSVYTPNSYVYTGPADYSFDFYLPSVTDLLVVHIDESGVSAILSDVNVVKNTGTDGGVATINSPVESGGVVYLYRDVPYVNNVAWKHEGGLDFDKLEANFDLLEYQIQQLLQLVESGNFTTVWRQDWVQLTTYVVKEMIRSANGNLYIAKVNHISTDSFTDDLAAGYWELFLDVATIRQYSEIAAEASVQAAESERICTAALNSVLLSQQMVDQSEGLAARSAIETRDCATATFELTVRAETAAEAAEAIVSSGNRTDAMYTDFETLSASQTDVDVTNYGPQENLLVFMNGIKLRLGQDYTTDSSTAATKIVLATAAEGGEEVEIICFNTNVLGA